MNKVFALVAAAVVAGCAVQPPAAPSFSGPSAMVSDYAQYEDSKKAKVFGLIKIDGQDINNTFWATTKANQGRGMSLSLAVQDRQVPARPMKVTLRASHMTGAPIHQIASQMAGTFFSVEGTVDFDPKPNGKYYVKGQLAKEQSSVWIEDEATGQPVTAKVTSP